jgi:hypothetical protein
VPSDVAASTTFATPRASRARGIARERRRRRRARAFASRRRAVGRRAVDV